MNNIMRRLLVAIIILATLVGLTQIALSAPGDLDASFAGFGAGGKVISTGVQIPDGPYRMALQPDGKILVTGHTGPLPVVMRYLPDGTLDETFSADGIAMIMTVYPSVANDVAIQADGKIVVTGKSNANGGSFLLARLTSTGEIDTSFGSGGLVYTDFDPNRRDEAFAVLVQTDGKIVAAGTVWDGDYDFGVVRYNANGTLDSTFSSDGKDVIGFGYADNCYDIALLDDGDLVVVGSQDDFGSDVDFAIARLNANGTLDNSFDFDGKLTTGFGGFDYARAVAIQPDGKILVAGDDGDNVRVARYLPNGVLDSSFDGDGKRSIGSLNGDIQGMAFQPDGKIVLVGSHESPDNDYKFVFYRLNPDSSLDSTFNVDGSSVIDFDGVDHGFDVALQADGRILAYGSSDSHPALVRLWPDGSLDAGGQQTLGFDDPFFGPNSQESAASLAIQADGRIVLAGEIADEGGNDSNFALARFLADGLPDTSFGMQGRVSFGFGAKETARAVAIQPDGKIVAAGTSGIDSAPNFMLARFNPDGSPDSTFGFLGHSVVDFGGGEDYGLAVSLSPDDKIVMAGYTHTGLNRDTTISVVRFNSNGSLDNTFDQDGKVSYQIVVGKINSANAVVVQSDRKIIVAGKANDDFALMRLNEDGSLDTSFGASGKVVTDIGGLDSIMGLVLGNDGALIAAGSHDDGADSNFALARYTASGLLDTGFGAGGLAVVDFGGDDIAYAVDLRSDGAIVAAGCSGAVFAVAQLQPNGALDPAFNTTGKATTDFVGSDECATDVRFYGSNRILTAGYQTVFGNSNMALARFETTVPSAPTPTPTPVPGDSNLFLPLIRRQP
jgi:uncharacterized delta-60 repeat protein